MEQVARRRSATVSATPDIRAVEAADDVFVHVDVPARTRVGVRVLDILGSVFLLILFSSLMLAVAVAVRLDSRGPVFFSQERVGRDGRTFRAWKFRTMSQDAPTQLRLVLDDEDLRSEFDSRAKLQRDPRVTRVGSFIRPLGLDELPQLGNVLGGSMSLVGPRPLVVDEVQKYGRCAEVVLQVKPGITGPWQIGGRNDIPYDERVDIDTDYALTKSLRRDLRILFKSGLLLFTGGLTGGY